MRVLLNFLQHLFGGRTVAAEDPLMGAVDLSDVPYCIGLLDSARDR